jgi:uncharacterized protein YjbI with pentapeptide repeats
VASKNNVSVPLRFAGKRVVIVEGRDFMRRSLEETLRGEGAEVVKNVTLDVDIVVTKGSGAPSSLEKRARELNKAGKTKIQIVSEDELKASIVPTREETLALLRGSAKDRERWKRLTMDAGADYDLSGESFRGIDLSFLYALDGAKLDRADLRDTNLTGSGLPVMRGARLDGARILDSSSVNKVNAVNCSMKSVRIEGQEIGDLSGSDLTGATLKDVDNYNGRFVKAVLRDAKLKGVRLDKANFDGADLTSAELRDARLRSITARGAKFVRANLAGADLTDADLARADLSGADLTGADLTGANLAGAKVNGAIFKHAAVGDTKLQGVDTSKAKGFELPENRSLAGPSIKRLEQLASKVKRLQSEVRADLPKGCVMLKIYTYGRGTQTTQYQWWVEGVPGAKQEGNYAKTMSGAFAAIGKRWLKGRLRPDTLKVLSKESPIGGSALKELFLGAWREALGADAAEAADAAKGKGKAAPNGKQKGAELLDELRGKGGVAKWNARSHAERTPAGGFQGADLAKAKLRGADFSELDFRKAKLDGADLSGADLTRCRLAGASFHGARLDKADLAGTDLRKVDFADAKLAGAKLRDAVFDETTILPKGFRAPKAMVWKGRAADPRVVRAAPSDGGGKELDAAAFMKRLTAKTDKSRLEKAVAMLKADRFKLFVEVGDDRLAGIVKSQSDDELVYACTLAADGGYACCTQNLNPCGGLRGALCKHLLVLVIGLAKGGEIDPGRVDGWIASGRGRAPALEKDAMTSILLRYKGAEAGEIDWRPTETVPEDYHAM